MTPLCITCMYNRPSVSAIFLENMDRLGIPVLSAVSEVHSYDICKNKAQTVWADNEPLGAKWNKVATVALDYGDWTHLVIAGDDDLFSEVYRERIEEFQDLPFIGLESIYMIDPKDRHALYFRYRKPTPVAIGTGKVLQRRVVEKMIKGDDVILFDPKLNKGLDYDNDMRLFEKGYRPVLIDDDKTLCVDVKTSQNIMPLRHFTDIAPRIDYDVAVSILSDVERGMLAAL